MRRLRSWYRKMRYLQSNILEVLYRMSTEHGVLQLANILKSARATQVSIKVIEIFVKMREMLTDTLRLHLDIELIKKKIENQDRNIGLVFSYLDELMEKKKSGS